MRILQIVSSKGGVGKTTLSLGIAQQLATLQDRKVIIVELDFIGPGIRAMTGLCPLDLECGLAEPELTLNELLLNFPSECGGWSRALARPQGGFDDKVHIIPSWLGAQDTRAAMPHDSSALATEPTSDETAIREKPQKASLAYAVWHHAPFVVGQVTNLLTHLASRYDSAILDCPPGMTFMTAVVLRAVADSKRLQDEHSLLWVMTPHPASIIGVYADYNSVLNEYPQLRERSLFVVNKVPDAAASGLFDSGVPTKKLWECWASYFQQGGVNLSIYDTQFMGLFRNLRMAKLMEGSRSIVTRPALSADKFTDIISPNLARSIADAMNARPTGRSNAR